MEVIVDGSRAGAAEREMARAIPREKLPQLTSAQRELIAKLGIPEEEYARIMAAGELSSEALLGRAQRVAQLLDGMGRDISPRATLTRLTLRTIGERYEAQFEVDGRTLLMRIPEQTIDDYFDAGSEEAEHRLRRALRRSLTGAIQ